MSLFLPDPNKPANMPRRWLLTVILLAVIGGGLAFKPLFQRFKRNRSEVLVQEGLLYQRDGQLDLAYQKGRAAYDLNLENVEALRLVAQVLTQQKKPEAFTYWSKVIASAKANENDYLTLLDLGFAFNYLETVEKYLNEAIKKFPQSSGLLKRASFYFAAKNDVERSSYYGQRYLLRAEGDEEVRMLLSRQLLSLGGADQIAMARTNLVRLARSSGAFSLPAIELLTRFTDLSAQELEIMLGRVNGLGLQDAKLDLLSKQIEIRLHPEKKQMVFSEIIERAKTGSLKELLEGAKWLFQQNALAEAQELLQGRAKENKEVYLLYADALAGLGKWAELEKSLLQPDLPIERFFQEMYLGRVTGELGRKKESDQHWKEAYNQAQSSPNALQYFAEYCEKIGRLADSEQAFKALSRRTQTAKFGLLNLIRLSENQGDLTSVRIYLKEYESKFADDVSVKNDISYIDLLTGNSVETAKGQAEALYRQNPSVFAFRTTLALAYLRKNEIQKATELYKGLTIDWKTLMPGWQAVYVSVLGSSNATNDISARQLAGLINTNRLKPQELELIKPWLSK